MAKAMASGSATSPTVMPAIRSSRNLWRSYVLSERTDFGSQFSLRKPISIFSLWQESEESGSYVWCVALEAFVARDSAQCSGRWHLCSPETRPDAIPPGFARSAIDGLEKTQVSRAVPGVHARTRFARARGADECVRLYTKIAA